jgi:hypothetical protein
MVKNMFCAAAMLLSFCSQGYAQVLDPLQVDAAYLTADPINTERLGLATLDGRYAIRPVQGCDWLVVGLQVTIYPNWNMPPWLSIGADGHEPDCIVSVEGRMSATPCFTNDAGLCDVRLEHLE